MSCLHLEEDTERRCAAVVRKIIAGSYCTISDGSLLYLCSGYPLLVLYLAEAMPKLREILLRVDYPDRMFLSGCDNRDLARKDDTPVDLRDDLLRGPCKYPYYCTCEFVYGLALEEGNIMWCRHIAAAGHIYNIRFGVSTAAMLTVKVLRVLYEGREPPVASIVAISQTVLDAPVLKWILLKIKRG